MTRWMRRMIDIVWIEAERERDQSTVDLCEAHSLLLDEHEKALQAVRLWEDVQKTPRLATKSATEALLRSSRGYLAGIERAVRCAGQTYRRLEGYRPEWLAGPSPLIEQRETPC